MCYSAKVWQRIKEYMRRHGVVPDYDQYELLFGRRLKDPSLRIPRGFEANFDKPESAQERRIHDLIAQHRAQMASKWQQELFAQKTRLADAQRKLKDKETKAARGVERIATNKIKACTRWLADLERTQPRHEDSRIYPMWFAPIIVEEDGARRLLLARYHCRQSSQPASIDRKFPGLYNARRDNLEKFWRHEFGQSHALFVIDAFFENVEREGKNVVLQFEPKPRQSMLVAALYARWQKPGEDDLLSFAAITDEPPPEIAAAGHDRVVINLTQDAAEAWLRPQGRSIAELRAVLDERDRPHYEHRVMAA